MVEIPNMTVSAQPLEVERSGRVFIFRGLWFLIILLGIGAACARDPAVPLGPEKAPDGHPYTMEEREAIGAQDAKRAREKAAQEAEAAEKAVEARERLRRLAAMKDENFKAGIRFLKDGRYGQALDKFREVQEVDPAYPGLAKEVAAAERLKKAEEARLEAATRKAAHANAVAERRSLGQKMRESLLDQGFDIKVGSSRFCVGDSLRVL